MSLSGPLNLTLLCHLEQINMMVKKATSFFDLSPQKKKKKSCRSLMMEASLFFGTVNNSELKELT